MTANIWVGTSTYYAPLLFPQGYLASPLHCSLSRRLRSSPLLCQTTKNHNYRKSMGPQDKMPRRPPAANGARLLHEHDASAAGSHRPWQPDRVPKVAPFPDCWDSKSFSCVILQPARVNTQCETPRTTQLGRSQDCGTPDGVPVPHANGPPRDAAIGPDATAKLRRGAWLGGGCLVPAGSGASRWPRG